ncbi:MAG: hypothetical protein IPG55_13635 [Saprospiraceae bacterium]|nr:hypothetical protein [Candidatus Defluviibacterium haderslevense]
MVQKDQEFNAQTRKKQGRYDKRLILKIVSDIESDTHGRNCKTNMD